jgi:hypothetical protein
MLLEPENGCNDKEAQGHDEGQNTKCPANDWQINACKIQ